MINDMRAHLVEQVQVRALGDQEIVGRPQHRAERISIGLPPIVAAAGAMIAHRLARAGYRTFE